MLVNVTPNEFPVLQSQIVQERKRLEERYTESSQTLQRILEENKNLRGSLDALKDLDDVVKIVNSKIRDNDRNIESWKNTVNGHEQKLKEFNKAVDILWQLIEYTCSHEYEEREDQYGVYHTICKHCGDT